MKKSKLIIFRLEKNPKKAKKILAKIKKLETTKKKS